MDIADAFQIVIDLAKQNIIDDPEYVKTANRQKEAIGIVEDFVVNQLGDD